MSFPVILATIAMAAVSAGQTVFHFDYAAPPDTLDGWANGATAIVAGRVVSRTQTYSDVPASGTGRFVIPAHIAPYFDYEFEVARVVKGERSGGRSMSCKAAVRSL